MKALRAVDDIVLQVAQALRDTDRLEETLIVFTSDNGIAFGEHRWKYKLTPYEESIRVPLVIRYDPLTEGDTTPALALNVISPTIAELAGVDLPGADGRSLVPILSGEAPAVRTDFLIEHAQYRSVRGRPDPPLVLRRPLATPHVRPLRHRRGRALRRLARPRSAPEPGVVAVPARHRVAARAHHRALRPCSSGLLLGVATGVARTAELCVPVPPGFSWE